MQTAKEKKIFEKPQIVWLQEWLELGIQMISEICHSPSLGSAFFCVSFILRLAKGYVLQINLTISAEREYLFPDSPSQSPGLVSLEPQLGQALEPSFVN